AISGSRTDVFISRGSSRTFAEPTYRKSDAEPARQHMALKIGTWNVNGIRARQAQLQELLDREKPDVICLQEIKSSIDQLPVWLCELEGYWCYWHGAKGYSGVGLHVSKALAPERPAFEHPAFDYENRIVL